MDLHYFDNQNGRKIFNKSNKQLAFCICKEVVAVTQQQQSGYLVNNNKKSKFNNQWPFVVQCQASIGHSKCGKEGK